MPAQVVSHYRLLNPLGSGGMGAVFRAEDTTLHRTVALKFLPERRGSDPKVHERLREEARTASALNHPNICTIYEVGEDSGEVFIAMEYVEGRSLSEIIRSGQPLATGAVLRYGVQIASALEHAHQRGVIHRDLKPLNIVINPQGDAKILDFGLARRRNPADLDQRELETAGTNATAELSGTLPYMAPEQLEGRGASPRTDIWSLGIVLYEMVTGARPFGGENLYRLCTAILREPTPALPAHVPAGLQSVIHRCLEKEQARRYQRAGEVRAALEALSSGTARGLIAETRRPWRGRALRAAAGIGALAALIFAGTIAVRSGRWARPAKSGVVPAKVLLAVLAPGGAKDTEAAFDRGLAETMTARLSELGGRHALAVIPMSEIRAKHVDSLESAQQQFGANLGLMFDVQRAAGQVRINYSLVEVRSREQLRGGTVTAPAADPFALQDRVCESVVAALDIQLEPQELKSLRAHGTNEPEAYDFYLQGRGYLQDYVKPENVESAIVLFQRSLAKDPRFAAANAGLGEAYWRKYAVTHDSQWTEAAKENCQKAAERDASLSAAHTCLGRVFAGTGETQKALEEYKRAVELEPTSDSAQGGLAKAYEQLNRLDDAEKTFKQAIAARPGYWATYNWLGLFYQRHARYEDAAAMYSQVVALAPDSFTGYYNLGGVRTLQGKYVEAIPLLEQSLKIRQTADARSNLATTYFQMKRYAESAAQFEEATKQDKNNYLLWGNLGDAYYWAPGRRGEAAAAYAQAIKLGEERLRVNPHDAEVLSSLAIYHAMRGERGPALDKVGAALKLKPRNPDLLFNAGIVYQQAGDTARALDSLEKAVAAGISLAALRDTPNFDNLRANPRFLKLISGK
jgi:eukaryotic-like serine/threonine-protein kinase